ncbi:YceI family protein [Mobilicoccus sp.]|uniref:YceI family protein n=1 Tax=Mobilicoccus sp. TaxID=2034349 RepID=UPI0028AEC84E|nr:YceI family protein [Mobilicoccus sp.]
MTTLTDLQGTYTIDPAHSRLGFVARHAMVTKVRGSFTEFEGAARTETGLENAAIELTAQVASIDTRNADRDGHLRTNDFFDAERFPTIEFRSTDVTAADDDTLRVTGDLTLKGVTKPVTIDFEYGGQAQDPYGNERIGFDGATTIDRSDFGITFNAALETGGVLVSDKIRLEFEVSAVKNA